MPEEIEIVDLGRPLPALLAQADAGCSGRDPDAEPPQGQEVCGGPPVPNPFAPLVKRGVAREVWEERGYIPYYGRYHPLYDPDAVRAVLDDYPTMADGQRNTLMKFMADARDAKPPRNTFLRFSRDPYVNPKTLDESDHDGHGGGLLMVKYPFPGEPEILPQLRPEYAVRTGRITCHQHDRDFLDDAEGQESLLRHLEDEHGGDRSFPANRRHEHAEYAKYLLAPNEKEDFWHDHETDEAFEGPKGAAKLRAHVRSKQHAKDDNRNVIGQHKHRRKKKGQSVANRIDILPASFARLETAEVVVVMLEGTPKADAVESEIREWDLPYAACDVPSVTLGNAPELKRVARSYLQGKLVLVACDADWHTNSQVVRQAFLFRERLRDILGYSVVVAAPPARAGQHACGCDEPTVNAAGACSECLGFLKGCDDYLAAGGTLGGLVILDRDAPFRLALFAKPDGTIKSSLWGFRDILAVRRDPESIIEMLENYVDRGFLLPPSRPLRAAWDEWTGKEEWTGRTTEWPVFTVAPQYRYTEHAVTLNDYVWVSIERETLNLSWLLVELDRAGAHIMDAQGVFPDKKAITEARARVAERLGCTERQVRDDPAVRLFCSQVQESRDVAVAALAGIVTNERLANTFGLTPKRISQILNERKERETMNDTEATAVVEELADDAERFAVKARQASELMKRYPHSPSTIAVERLLTEAVRVGELAPELL